MKKLLFNSILLIIACFACTTFSFAQDVIYKKDKTTINAKISEVGLDDIKYKEWNNLDGPDFIMLKSDIQKIRFANGTEMIITPDPYSVNGDVEIRNKTRIIKFDFFAPLLNHITFGYEWMYKVGFNIEAKFGIIGPGVTPGTDNPSGAFVKIGPKFLLGSDYVMHGMQYAHAMRGRYFKPELIVSIYTKNITSYYNNITPSSQRIQFGSYGLNLVYGRQSIFGKVVTLDWFVGVGYAIHTFSIKDNTVYTPYGPGDKYQFDSTYDYSNLYLGHSFPLILSGGVTVGYLF